MDHPQNIPKIDRGRSILNATDEKANPYGLILSVKEREFIYGALNRIDHRADAILNGKKGWKQQAEAKAIQAAQGKWERMARGQ